jgi:hypothetical protein
MLSLRPVFLVIIILLEMVAYPRSEKMTEWLPSEILEIVYIPLISATVPFPNFGK